MLLQTVKIQLLGYGRSLANIVSWELWSFPSVGLLKEIAGLQKSAVKIRESPKRKRAQLKDDH